MNKPLTILFTFIAIISLVSCGGEATDDAAKGNAAKEKPTQTATETPSSNTSFVGKWVFDVETMMAKEPKMAAASLPEKEKARAMFATMKMSFEFTADGKISSSMTAGDKVKINTASYTIKSTDKNKFTIETIDEKQQKETVEITVEGDKLTMENSGQKIYLKKQ